MSYDPEYHRRWAARNRDRLARYGREYRRRDYVRTMLRYAKSRAKALGLAFDLTRDDIALPTHCPVLGIELDYAPKDSRKNRDNAPSLDRIDPRKGYVSGNVQVISLRANRIKNDATVDELRRVADYMEVMHG